MATETHHPITPADVAVKLAMQQMEEEYDGLRYWTINN
jgi:hypothetical protein